ncbi:MAG: RluA family pseudouridine synthase [Holosporales bacterium]|jgi:23S rRNA pseudouridine955/2504/2580 synthase|nr:RluA family pseudouridine synthase [Holosporales bacterium]
MEEVWKEFNQTRLDKVIKNRFGKSIPQSMIEKALRNKDILINGARANASDKVTDDIEIFIHPTIMKLFQGFAVKLHIDSHPHLVEKFKELIVYEDDNLIIIDKPSGLAVQKGSKTDMAVDIMAKAYNEHARLVHRIDKDTSGITILAKGAKMARYMLLLFQNKMIEKRYNAIVTGVLPSKAGIVDSPLLKIPERVIIDPLKGKNAITKYRILRTYGKYSLISAIPITGRTHQIRVHMASLGCPIFGDTKYGGQKFKHLCLHAEYVSFREINGDKVCIEIPVPEYFPSF